MRQEHHTLELETPGRGLFAFGARVEEWLKRVQARGGLLTVFIQHISAILLIQEDADPQVLADLERFFAKLGKDGDPMFVHDAEGPDDMPAHVRGALTQTHLAVPVVDGRMALGIWQGLYVYEHRIAPHRRRLALHYLGG